VSAPRGRLEGEPHDWLPPGCDAAVCLSVDDVHPGRSSDHYEAGGDLDSGVLGRLERLIEPHPELRATLFVTPDWRERSPVPTRALRSRLPLLSERLHLTPPRPRGSMRIDRHPGFAAYLRRRPRFEIAHHGLTHLARGPRPPAEFDGLRTSAARRRLRRARRLFADAALEVEPGFCPPAWGASPALLDALAEEGFGWVSAARDIDSPIEPRARAVSSGPPGVSLLAPHWVAGGRLVHIPVNFQATSDDRRALAILDHGGLLSIKAHAVKDALGHIALDGLDHAYCARLDGLFSMLRRVYGERLWWTTMGAVAARVRSCAA
jgi:peptidoglycan/xylan/chitin deacetylase (PgdA/CDA1 family)